MAGLYHMLFKKNKNEKSQINEPSLNKINRSADNIFALVQPKVYSMAEEMNICKKITDNILLTKDNNFVIGFELLGTSYASLTSSEEMQLLQNKVDFLNKINSQLEINIIMQKKIHKTNNILKQSGNYFADEIVTKWGGIHKYTYSIKYYIIASTTKKILTGALESFKDSFTKEKDKENNEEKLYKQKQRIIAEFIQKIYSELDMFKPRLLSANDLLNIYASYANADETNLKYSYETLSDCFITSNAEFFKNYIKHTTNQNKEIFSCFISVKAYETESINSLLTSNLLKCPIEYMIFLHLKPYEKEKSIKKIKDTAAFATEIVRNELSDLLELVKADRENLIETSYSIYLKANNLEELENNTNEIIKILKFQGLSVVREDLNLKALYFSFFASRGNLNARKKTLKTSNLSTICTFEKEVTGFNKNDWGEGAVTHFTHSTGTQFLFNFHCEEYGDRPAGHTMIIGGTGGGKTTLIQFLMCNLFKYPIDIFAMDKLHGMYVFTEFVNGEYHGGDNFKVNPFSLEPNKENLEFLEEWLGFMAGIDEDHAEEKDSIHSTLKRLYENTSQTDKICLKNFVDSLTSSNNLKIKFNPYLDSIFNNEEDALNFNQQLSILNMDGLTNGSKNSSLIALYIFHKLKVQAKNNTKKRGFFCFIDELKDYINDETMRKKILEAILEVRKIGGVMCLGFQNLGMFENIPDSPSFLSNIANFLIYPTNDQKTIEILEKTIGLTQSEAKFLRETDPKARKILLKMKIRNESAVLDVNLSRLGNHLKVFSSSSDNVNLVKKIKAENSQNWREIYLNTTTTKEL